MFVCFRFHRCPSFVHEACNKYAGTISVFSFPLSYRDSVALLSYPSLPVFLLTKGDSTTEILPLYIAPLLPDFDSYSAHNATRRPERTITLSPTPACERARLSKSCCPWESVLLSRTASDKHLFNTAPRPRRSLLRIKGRVQSDFCFQIG